MSIKKNTTHATKSRPTVRLQMRAPTDVIELIRRAADISNVTVSQFLAKSALDKAIAVIDQHCVVRLTEEGASALYAALKNPPAPTPYLLEAAARYEQRTNGGKQAR